MNRRLLVSLSLILSAVAVGVLPNVASAYPPGTDLQISSSTSQLKWGAESITISAKNTAAEAVTFKVNGVLADTKTPVSGSASWVFAPTKSGKYTITTQSGTEAKSVVVYVPTKPKFAPKQRISKAFSIAMAFIKPGSVATVKINGKLNRKVKAISVKTNGLATFQIPAKALKVGSNKIQISLAGMTITGTVKGTK